MSTFVLVHDAWHAGQVWDRVVPGLEAAGHTGLAPSLTGHGPSRALLGPEVGLQTHVDDIAGLLESQQLEEIVLVGHGYAGLIIEGVADRVPERIAQLVYLDAMIPADGEAAVDIDAPTRERVERAAGTDAMAHHPGPPGRRRALRCGGPRGPSLAWHVHRRRVRPLLPAVRAHPQPTDLPHPARAHRLPTGSLPAGCTASVA